LKWDARHLEPESGEMKMKSFLNRKVRLAFGFAMLTLLLMGTMSYRWMIISDESSEWVRHTHAVIEHIQDLSLTMENIESASRGFVLSGKESDLTAYRSNVLRAGQDEATIRNLTVDNPAQQNHFPTVETLATERIQHADTIIALRRNDGQQAAIAAIERGPEAQVNDEFQAIMDKMQDEELRLLAQRMASTDYDRNQTRMILIAGTILGILIAALAAWSAIRDSTKRSIAEEALQQSEEKYRMLLDGVQDYAIFMLDPRGTVVSWSASAAHIKGYTSPEIIGKNFSRFFTPEDIGRGRPEEVLRLAATNGRHEEFGMRVRKDQTLFLASVTFIALRDAAGNLRGFSEICRDLSEHKESEVRYRGLLEAAPDGMVVVNHAGEIVLLNAQAEKQFGYRRDELIGQKVTNIIPTGFAERLIADGTRTAAEALSQQIGTGIELTGRRKDGSEFPIEIMLSPLESAEGILVTAAIRDITVRKDAEKVLVQMEARYRGLLEAAPDAMVVVNQAGEIVLLNAQAENQFGHRRDELIGQRVTNIIPEGFAERLIADGTRTAAEALAQQIGTGIELVGRRNDGSEFPIEIMLSPLESAEGTLVTVAIRNITPRKELEKRVEERTKAIAQQSRNFNTTIASIVDHAFMFDPQGRFVYANQAFLDVVERTMEEVIGKTCFELPYTRELAERVQSQVQQVVSTKQKVVDVTHYVNPSGLDIYSEYFFSPMLNADGVVEFVAGGAFDITKRKKAEVHLAQMEGRYRGLLEAAPDGMVVVDDAGEIVLLNAQAENQFGYRRDELLGQRVTNIIPVGFAERLKLDGTRTAAEALAQQIGTGIELIGLRKDGSKFPIEIMLSPLESPEGILVTAAIRDITVRKDAEKHLAEMEGRYRGLMEAAPDGMVVVNQAGEIVILNARAEGQFGYRRDELLGQKVTNIIPTGFAERLIADGTRTAAEALEQQIGTGIELYGQRKDGTEFPIEIMLSPLASPEGILVTAAIRDITIRKDAERHLAQMEGKYRGLMEAAPDGMVVVNTYGEIVLLNARAESQFGYRRDELLGRKVKSIIPEGFAERLVADALRTTAEALAQQIGTGIELNGRRRDGTEFPIEIMLSPLDSPEGILVTAAIRDISERKQLARQLHQSQKMEAVGQLTGGIAHDFNNLLGVITGNLDLLERLVPDNLQAIKRVQTAQKAAARGADITRRLLVFSSNEELKPSMVLLGDSIQNMIELASHGLGPNIKITTRIDESVPRIFIDPAGLESALLNLVVNARDAMPKGGSILIASHVQTLDESHPAVHTGDLKPGNYVCIAVTDSGQGMSRQTMERIFEPFFTTKPRDKGTGLGLAMVWGFVRQSGGTVRVYSEVDHGTTVSFYLPLTEDFLHPVAADTPKASIAQFDCTVLVVDDEVDLLEIATAYLAEMGFTSCEAKDGASALDILAQRPDIDLMVTDIVMPGGMNGVELVQKARVLYPNLKIIYSSGFPAEALAERSMSLVDGPLLHKPYQRGEFAAIIHRVMDSNYATPAL
jgi:PAS domain S-box-containing protein